MILSPEAFFTDYHRASLSTFYLDFCCSEVGLLIQLPYNNRRHAHLYTLIVCKVKPDLLHVRCFICTNKPTFSWTIRLRDMNSLKLVGCAWLGNWSFEVWLTWSSGTQAMDISVVFEVSLKTFHAALTPWRRIIGFDGPISFIRDSARLRRAGCGGQVKG